MSWFKKKAKPRKLNISATLQDDTRTNTTPILDGDENAATPVEGANLGKLARLHPFSPVAISLLHLFDREDVDIREIGRLVGSDAALAAETLAYVNSPLFSMREPVTELSHAITILGAEKTKALATTLAMRSMLKSAPKAAVVRRIWKHSIATAVVAAELAPVFGVGPDLANTAGVLHDVGRLGLLAQYGEDYARIVLSLYDDVDAILKEEREICALDHCNVGMYLGKVWKLPEVFQEVAEKHHRTDLKTGLMGLIHASCAMADDLGFSAIAHRRVMNIDDRLLDCVDESLRAKVKGCWEGAEKRVSEKVNLLDF